MFKCFQSEKGGTLMLVFGFIVMISLVIAPLAMSTNIGLLQAKTNGNKEAAFTKAHSAMTVFARLYEESKTKGVLNTKVQVEKLVAAVNAMSDLHADLTILKDNSNNPIAVLFTADEGYERLKRNNKVRFNLGEIAPEPTATPMPTATPIVTPTPLIPTPPPTPVTQKVLVKDNTTTPKKHNKLFAACYYEPPVGESLPDKYFNNSFTQAQFNSWFDSTADSYLNAATLAIANEIADPRLAKAAAQSNTTPSGALSISKSRAAVNHTGTVNIGGSSTQNITQAVLINSDSNGNALTATGNLDFTDIIQSEVKFAGNVKVGGNLRVRDTTNTGSIVFGGDVYVRGDVDFGYNGDIDSIIVEGDLIINGNLKMSNTLQKLIVHGDIVIGGTTSSTYPIHLWEVGGKMVAKGAVTLSNTVYAFKVAKNVIIGDKLSLNSTVQNYFNVGGSLLVKNDLTFNNTVYNVNINEHIIVGGKVQFTNTIEKEFIVGGSFVARGDITFANDTKQLIHIGKNMITKSNLSFNPYGIDGGLQIDGMLLVFQDANFQALEKDWHFNKMEGFYIGGVTTFYSNYSQSWYINNLNSGSQQESICITKS
jgi:predicted acyltransferase (DUF342 family)